MTIFNLQKINFAFNQSFDKPEEAIEYERYKQELSHKKYMIDRQRDRLEGIKTPDAIKIKEIWKGEFESLAAQIKTLESIQPDTIGYSEAQKDIKRYKQAEKIALKIKENNDKDIINYGQITEFLNLVNNSVEYTPKDAMSLARKTNDMLAMEDFLSPESEILKEYKELYSDEGFALYKKRKEEYKKSVDEIKKEESKDSKKEEILSTLPESTNTAINEAVDKTVGELFDIEMDENLTDEEKLQKQKEIRDKLNEVVTQNQPIEDVSAPIVSPPIVTKIETPAETKAPVVKVPIVSSSVVEEVNKFDEKNSDIRTKITDIEKRLNDGEMLFDFTEEEQKIITENNLLTNKEQTNEESNKSMLEGVREEGNENPQQQESEQLRKENKVTTPDISATETKQIEINHTAKFFQNDFYITKSAYEKDPPKFNKLLKLRKELLNNIDNINNIQWRVERVALPMKENEKLVDLFEGNNIAKFGKTPAFKIITNYKNSPVLLYEFRDIKSSFAINPKFVTKFTEGMEEKELTQLKITPEELNLPIKDSKKYSEWISVFKLAEKLKEKGGTELDDFLRLIRLDSREYTEMVTSQKVFEKIIKQDSTEGIKLERVLNKYNSTTSITGTTMAANYSDIIPWEDMQTNVYIDPSTGEQYHLIMKINLPYIKYDASNTVENEEEKNKEEDDYKEKLRNAIASGRLFSKNKAVPDDLELKIKKQLIAQLENKGFFPVHFLESGYNIIFSDSEGSPYVKHLLSGEYIPFKTGQDVLNVITTPDKNEQTTRTDGWHVIINGIGSKINTPFKIDNIKYNNWKKVDSDETFKSLVFTVAFTKKEGEEIKEKTVRIHVPFNEKNKNDSVQDIISKRLNEAIPKLIKKEYGIDVKTTDFSFKFVAATMKEPQSFDEIISTTGFVTPAITFDNKNNTGDMRNGEMFNFYNDRIVPREMIGFVPKNDRMSIPDEAPTVTENKEGEKDSVTITPSIKEEDSDMIKTIKSYLPMNIPFSKEHLDIPPIAISLENLNNPDEFLKELEDYLEKRFAIIDVNPEVKARENFMNNKKSAITRLSSKKDKPEINKIVKKYLKNC